MGPTTYLYVPGNKLDFVEKAFNKGAENIFIDLEDSISIQLKSTVRDSVCNFLKEGKLSNIYVRINSIDSFQEEDISALNKIKFKNIVIPKLEKNSAIIKKGLHKKFEKEYLNTQLNKFGGNISKTAKFVGMERSALHRKLKMLGIKGLN